MNLNPKAELAWEVCTHKIIEVSPNISIKEAAELMIKNKIHHIIISKNNSLKGIVSLIDITENCLLKQNA
jgi:CBS domain-containing protein